MSLDNSTLLAVSSVLKNPILQVLREINISKYSFRVILSSVILATLRFKSFFISFIRRS